jgi:hypothetical protein
MLPFPTDASSFFVWLVSPGAQGLILTLGLERWPWFQLQTSTFKRWSTFIGSLLWPFPTTVLVAWLGLVEVAFPVTPQEYVLWGTGLALQGLVVWATTQYGHQFDPQTSVNRAKAPIEARPNTVVVVK